MTYFVRMLEASFAPSASLNPFPCTILSKFIYERQGTHSCVLVFEIHVHVGCSYCGCIVDRHVYVQTMYMCDRSSTWDQWLT